MKSTITLEPPARETHLTPILSKNGYTCAVATIAPRQELAIEAAPSGGDRLVFVVAGEVTIRSGEIATMLSTNEAHLLSRDKDSTIVAAEGKAAKLLRVDVPPRQVFDAPLYSFETSRP